MSSVNLKFIINTNSNFNLLANPIIDRILEILHAGLVLLGKQTGDFLVNEENIELAKAQPYRNSLKMFLFLLNWWMMKVASKPSESILSKKPGRGRVITSLIG